MDSKKMYVYSQPLMLEIVAGFVIGQLPLLSYKKLDLYVATMCWLAILYVNVRSYVDLGSPLLRVSLVNLLPAKTKNVRIYIEAAIVVVISYVLLLRISWSFIWFLLFPIITIGFIVALCKELSHEDEAGGSHSQEQSNEGEATASSGEKAEGLKAVALVPYLALCMMMGHFHDHADKFAVSPFLLFSSFMLVVLTMMMTRLVRAGLATAHRGIVPASELLWKASLVVLLVALHAVAAELLGENALLLCMPEILPVLLWLSVRLDCDDDPGVTTDTADDRIKPVLDSNLLPAALAAVLAMLAAGYMDESLLYWCGKALVSCAISAILTSYVVFMLCQWPGGQGDGTITAAISQHAVNLLKSWAKFLLKAVAALLIFISVVSFQLVLLQEPVASSSADQILHRLCQKILQFII